jgi:lambda repressor-like predicted transcriptional regulator
MRVELAWPFNKIVAELARKAAKLDRLMIGTTHLKPRRIPASLLKKGCSLTYRAYKGRLNSKLHALCDGQRLAAEHTGQR